jgi:hypothetical protein
MTEIGIFIWEDRYSEIVLERCFGLDLCAGALLEDF